MRKAFTLVELLVVILIIILLLAFLGCGVGPLVYYLFFGWYHFLAEKLPNTTVNGEAVVTSVLTLVLLYFTLHGLLRWYAASSVASGGSGRSPWPHRRTAAVLGVLILMFTAGIAAVGITHQTAWLVSPREPMFRSERQVARAVSQNNLKQVGLAVHNLADSEKRLPAGYVSDRLGRPLHGWQTMLLPYIEQEPLFRAMDLTRPWDDPVNRPHTAPEQRVFVHPGIAERQSAGGFALSHYAANVHVVSGDKRRTFDDFPRGTSYTILAGEVSAGFKPWAHPVNWRDPALGLHQSPQGFGGPIKKATQFLMLDGSVRSFKDDTDPEFLALIAKD